MKLYTTLTADQVATIATDLHIDLYEVREEDVRTRGKFKGKRMLQFRIVPEHGRDKWRLKRANPFSSTGNRRRVHAICWHGHYAFMKSVLITDPSAVFVTAVDTWDGLTDFTRRAPHSGDKNIGSVMYPDYYRDACDCEGETRNPMIDAWLATIDKDRWADSTIGSGYPATI